MTEINSTPSSPKKTCSKCGTEYPATTEHFARSSRNTDGLRGECKKCNAIYYRKNAEAKKKASSGYYRLHKQQVKEAKRKHYIKNKAEINAKNRKWHHDNKDKNNAKRRLYYLEHLEHERETSRNYGRTHREELRNYRKKYKEHHSVYGHRRMARKKSLPDDFTIEDWRYALVYFGNRCAYCGNPIGFWQTLAKDHFIPIAASNSPGTVPSNIVPACHSTKGGSGGCNNLKLDEMPLEWLIKRFGKRRGQQIYGKILLFFETVRKPD